MEGSKVIDHVKDPQRIDGIESNFTVLGVDNWNNIVKNKDKWSDKKRRRCHPKNEKVKCKKLILIE